MFVIRSRQAFAISFPGAARVKVGSVGRTSATQSATRVVLAGYALLTRPTTTSRRLTRREPIARAAEDVQQGDRGSRLDSVHPSR